MKNAYPNRIESYWGASHFGISERLARIIDSSEQDARTTKSICPIGMHPVIEPEIDEQVVSSGWTTAIAILDNVLTRMEAHQ